MFVDGDDYLFSENALGIIYNHVKDNNVDILQFKMVYLYGDDKYVQLKNIIDINQIDNKTTALRELNKAGNISVSACDKIVKRKITTRMI